MSRIADEYDAIGDRLKAIKGGYGGVLDYVDRSPAPGSVAACQYCGRTNEKPALSPCTGKCGLPPGGRAGQGADYYDGCG